MAGEALRVAVALLAVSALPSAATAQRVDDDAVRQAEDAFGLNIGNEQIGLYTQNEVRGFSPVSAGNIRIEGLYIDRPGSFSDRLVDSSTIRVGLSAHNFLFPAPTGIVDYRLRKPGAEPGMSVVAGVGPLRTATFEVDARVPIIGEKLGLVAGASAGHDATQFGSTAVETSWSAALRWRPSSGVELVPFASRDDIYDREAKPTYVTAGPFLLPPIRRGHYTGPKWAKYRGYTSNTGMIGTAQLGTNLRFAGGLFRSINVAERGYAHQVLGITPDLQGRRLLRADPPHRSASWSGEARLSRTFADGDRRHIVHLSVRARDRRNAYGGAATINLETGPIETASTLPRPAYTFGQRTFDKVRQVTAGVAYDGQWRNRGSLGLGLQRISYRKRVSPPGAPVTTTTEETLLYNAALAVQPMSRLILFGGYTRGLEESGTAPDSALNRTQALPAILTRQADVGLRWTFSDALKGVVSLFEIRKPYFAADERNIFTELGNVTNRGIELSLAGKLTRRLDVVGGAVLLDPRVSGKPVEDGRVGVRPVGQTRRLLTFNANYAVDEVPGLTLTGTVTSHSGRFADRANLVETPATTTFGVGGRYRFRLVGAPALLRVQVVNVTNVFEWKILGDSAYEVNAPRTIQGTLTVDF